MSIPMAELQLAPPSEKSPSKVLLFGVEGVGKTTLAAQFPNPLFIDIEGSTSKLKPQPKRLPDVDGYLSLKKQLAQVLNMKHDFKTLVIDSATVLERWVEEFVVAKGAEENANIISIESFGYGKGYKLVEEEFGKFLDFMDRLMKEKHMNIVFVAHSIVRQAVEPGAASGYDRYEVNLSKKVAPLLKQWADAVLFANYKNITVEEKNGKARGIGGKERVLYCNHTAVIDAKNRFSLADSVPMTIESLKPLFE